MIRVVRSPDDARRLRRRDLAGVRDALKLDDDALVHLARNRFQAAFLDDTARARQLAELDAELLTRD